MMEIWALYSTFAHREEALSVARALLDKRLIACANIQENVTSLYRWKGEIKQEGETLLLAKTSKHRLEDAVALIKSMHPYEIPCIAAYPVSQGFMPFLQWVNNETA